MTQPLRIAVADDELDMRDYFREVLPRLGHTVVAIAQDGTELIEQCRAVEPDLVVTDIKMPGIDGIDASIQICQIRPVPVILVSAHQDATLIERAETDHIMAYLIKPVKQSELAPAIALGMRRFEQFTALRTETADLRQALADRKTIERAKGILMKKANLDEAAAFRRLQKLASAKNLKLANIASMIVTADEAFQE